MFAKDYYDRHLHLLAPLQRLAEHRGLVKRQAHIQTHQHQQSARQKRQPPAKIKKLFVG